MNTLKQNIKNIYGAKGEAWIADLQSIVGKLIRFWGLKHISPVDNMTFNYVAKAVTSENQTAVLKICCDAKTIEDEKKALMYFHGNGSVQLIDYNEEHHALLLQQAVPGISLKSIYESQPEYVMDCYIETMNKLHKRNLASNHGYRHISVWLQAIDRLVSSDVCPSHLVNKAVSLKNSLLSSMTAEVFLHGDLHHDNILKSGELWLAIDPKGIVGEPEFEIAAFDFMYISELVNKDDVRVIFESRVNALSQKARLNAERIKGWVFVRLILMVAWYVEDNGDPSRAIKLAEMLVKCVGFE